MKSTIRYSTFSTILTFAVLGALIAGLYVVHGEPAKFTILAAVIAVLLIAAMIYCPLSISANDKEVNIHSPFKIHTIPMRDIVSIERFRPTMGSIRICGSGGFLGYWGMFKEGDTGRYMAYYGKLSDCFMVRTANGDKYVLGCDNTDAMVDYIKSHISRNR